MRSAFPALLLFTTCLSAALQAQTADRYAAYAHCKFADDLSLVESTPLPPGVQGRTVKTIMGPRQVPLASGTRLLYAYPQTEPFANVKIERIPADNYAQARLDLIANFEQILTGDDSSSRNYALRPRLNGLEIYGLDRKELAGGVLGIYLFFGDRSHTAVTVYFLNQEPASRSFSTLEGYARLRDEFLNAYTTCATGGKVVPHREPRTAQTAESAPGTTPAAPVVTAAPTPAVSVASAPVSAAPASTALPEAPVPQGALAAEGAPAQPVSTAAPSVQSSLAATKQQATLTHSTQASHPPPAGRPVLTKKLATSRKAATATGPAHLKNTDLKKTPLKKTAVLKKPSTAKESVSQKKP